MDFPELERGMDEYFQIKKAKSQGRDREKLTTYIKAKCKSTKEKENSKIFQKFWTR